MSLKASTATPGEDEVLSPDEVDRLEAGGGDPNELKAGYGKPPSRFDIYYTRSSYVLNINMNNLYNVVVCIYRIKINFYWVVSI